MMHWSYFGAELKEQFELARTDSQQMKKDLKEGLISQWYTLVKKVVTMLKEDLTEEGVSYFFVGLKVHTRTYII